MQIIKGLLDRVCFALGVLLFMQVPHFIDQYTQRLGGYYQAQLEHLHQYQDIANKQHRGNLELLIKEFEASNRQSVREAGVNIRNMRDESHALKEDVNTLEGRQFIFKLLHMFTGLHYKVANETMRTYKLGVPLSVEGVFCGIAGGVLLSLLFNGCLCIPGLFKHKDKQHLNEVAKRIEPTVTRARRAKI